MIPVNYKPGLGVWRVGPFVCNGHWLVTDAQVARKISAKSRRPRHVTLASVQGMLKSVRLRDAAPMLLRRREEKRRSDGTLVRVLPAGECGEYGIAEGYARFFARLGATHLALAEDRVIVAVRGEPAGFAVVGCVMSHTVPPPTRRRRR